MPPIIAAAIVAGGTIYAANKASSASDKASKTASSLQRDTLAQNARLTAPYRAFGEAGLSQLSRLLGLKDTTTERQNYIPLPGISTTGQHGKQTSGGGVGGMLDNPINTLKGTTLGLGSNATVTGGGPGGAGLFYDPSTHRIVDGEGTAVAQVPEGGGVISGLIHGFNNKVSIDANGSLTSIGSHGEAPMNIRLTPAAPGADQASSQPSILDTLRSMPGYQFRLKEGLDATKKQAGALGMTLSGNTLRALDDYSTGLADSTYQQEVNNLMGVTSVGENAATGYGNTIGSVNSNLGNIAMQNGENQGNIGLNAVAGIGKALQTGYEQYNTQRTLQGLQDAETAATVGANGTRLFNSLPTNYSLGNQPAADYGAFN